MATVEPRCMFALFARGYHQHDSGIDLLDVQNRITIIPSEHGYEGGLMTHLMALFCMVFADEGRHVLSFVDDGNEYVDSAEFEILPEHDNTYLVVVEREFPVGYADVPTVHKYPILLDGAPLATAYLLSRPL